MVSAFVSQVPIYSAKWSTPDLSSVQPEDYTAVPANKDFNDNKTDGKMVLFFDSRFQDTLDKLPTYNGDYQDLLEQFDGYALYTKVNYKFNPPEANKILSISRGLFYEIPVRGFTGWVCTTKYGPMTTPKAPLLPQPTVVTVCNSRFIPGTDYLANLGDDLAEPRPSDDQEKNGFSVENGNWICGTKFDSKETQNTVECTEWLPNPQDSSTNPSIYRFKSGKSYNVKGYIGIRKTEDKIPFKASWIDFGPLQLNRASLYGLEALAITLLVFINLS